MGRYPRRHVPTLARLRCRIVCARCLLWRPGCCALCTGADQDLHRARHTSIVRTAPQARDGGAPLEARFVTGPAPPLVTEWQLHSNSGRVVSRVALVRAREQSLWVAGPRLAHGRAPIGAEMNLGLRAVFVFCAVPVLACGGSEAAVGDLDGGSGQ